jgi:sortase B
LPTPPANDIDFAALSARNPDAYAWLRIPDTAVDLPILQHPEDDNYYLNYDVDHGASGLGAIYSQSMNSKDFSDPVTVMYGHTFDAGSSWENEMFGTLHYFEDPAFFDSHPFFYIYTPEGTLTYQVASVYEYDSRHIMNTFDFADKTVLQDYFNSVIDPHAPMQLVRDIPALKAGTDRIVQLSTCTRPANDAARFIVTGVLVSAQAR